MKAYLIAVSASLKSDTVVQKWIVDIAVFTSNVFFQAEDGIRDRSPSRGLGDVYKRQLTMLHMRRKM